MLLVFLLTKHTWGRIAQNGELRMTDRVRLGNYQLIHLLGEGGFAEVYLSKIKEQTWDKICWPSTNNAQKVA